MITDQERKTEVVKYADGLCADGVAKVTVSYCGEGDEGRSEPPCFQDAAGNPLDESLLSVEFDIGKFGELLEGFAPDGYEDGEGGFGTVTFNVQTLGIRVEHNWYETVSHPDEPREI